MSMVDILHKLIVVDTSHNLLGWTQLRCCRISLISRIFVSIPNLSDHNQWLIWSKKHVFSCFVSKNDIHILMDIKHAIHLKENGQKLCFFFTGQVLQQFQGHPGHSSSWYLNAIAWGTGPSWIGLLRSDETRFKALSSSQMWYGSKYHIRNLSSDL